jgi:hypothetical protein
MVKWSKRPRRGRENAPGFPAAGAGLFHHRRMAGGVISEFARSALLVMLTVLAPARQGRADDAGIARGAVTNASTTPGYDITFVLDKPYLCGQYANGDWWVAADPETGHVALDRITPDAVGGRNGWSVNPTDQNAQPYDDRARIPYDASLMPALPYAARGGESILKTAACSNPPSRYPIPYAAVLTVVDQPVAESHTVFRPPYAGTNKPAFRTTDLQTQWLPRLAPMPSAISQGEAETRVRNVRIDYSSHWAFPDCQPIDATMGWGGDMSVRFRMTGSPSISADRPMPIHRRWPRMGQTRCLRPISPARSPWPATLPGRGTVGPTRFTRRRPSDSTG